MQVTSLAGAVLVLAAYGSHQAGRMESGSYLYQVLNLLGGVLLLAAAITTAQAGLILVEGAWAVVSAYGLVRVVRRRAREGVLPASGGAERQRA